MVALWPGPEFLPQTFAAQGFGHMLADNLITDDYEVGPPAYRRRTTSAPQKLNGQMFMTTAEWETLYNFFRTTLFDGVMQFLLPPQAATDDSRYWICRFIKPPSRQMTDADDLWSVLLSLERLGIGQAFVLPSAFSDPTVIYQPRMIYDQFLVVARYNDPDTFRSVAVSAAGAEQTLLPLRYDDADTVYAPSITTTIGEDQTLVPARYDDADTFYAPAIITEFAILLEGGDDLLLENGDRLLIQ